MSIKTVIKKFSTETTIVMGQLIVHDLSEMCAQVVPESSSTYGVGEPQSGGGGGVEVSTGILLESGDFMLLESGDFILQES